MKLLYFTIQINMVGGLARIVIDKINWLVDHGYEVALCNIEALPIQPAYPIDPRVELIRGDIQTKPGGILTRAKGVIGAVNRTKEVIRQVKPDIIMNAHCPLVTWILPFVCRDIPKIVEIHQSRQGLDVFNHQFMSPIARWGHHFAIKWIYSKYNRFVVLTHGDKESWQCKNCQVIPNFFNVNVNENVNVNDDAMKRCRYENGELRTKTKTKTKTEALNEDEKVDVHVDVLVKKQIIMLARLMPQKRIDLMIDVWAELAKDFPDWSVKVLGEGLLRPELEKKIETLGLQDSFLLPGEVKDVTDELQASNILCLTSEYEGFGIVLIEAMAKGIPVIAFEYVGVHDIINDGVDGLIVPFGDVHGYAQKLRQLMTDQELCERLATAALSSVHKFDKEKVMQKWVELFGSF